jgi:hypothetical protein
MGIMEVIGLITLVLTIVFFFIKLLASERSARAKIWDDIKQITANLNTYRDELKECDKEQFTKTLDLMAEESKARTESIGIVFRRFDEFKEGIEGKYLKKEICNLLHSQLIASSEKEFVAIRRQLEEIKLDLKALINHNNKESLAG